MNADKGSAISRLDQSILSPSPYKMFWSFFLSFSLLDYITLSQYLYTYEWSIPMRESSFQTNKFIGNCGVGKDWASPFFPPSKICRSFYWSFSLSVFVTLSMYLNTYEWSIPKRECSSQPKKFFCTATLWGGKRLGQPILFPLENVLIFLFIFQSLGSCCSFMASYHLWMICFKERIKFKSNNLLVLLHWWVGKDWAGPFFPPPPKCYDLSIYLSVFWIILLFDCIWTLLNDLFQSEN